MKTLAVLLIGLIAISTSFKNPTEKQEGTKQENYLSKFWLRDGVFIHITESYSDPHRVLMPLKMANIMAADKDVLVYFDIHAVELLTKTSGDMKFADFDPLKKLLQDLIDKKAKLYACPTCMKISKIKPEDLIAGIQVAEKEKLLNFTSGRIITLDY